MNLTAARTLLLFCLHFLGNLWPYMVGFLFVFLFIFIFCCFLLMWVFVSKIGDEMFK